MNDPHGDEDILYAASQQFKAGRQQDQAGHPEPVERDETLPTYDLRMIEMAEQEIAAAQLWIGRGRKDMLNFEEVVIGIVDCGDTIRRALGFYRRSLQQ